MRRFGWQIGGVSVAVSGVVLLGLLAFGCGGSARTFPTARPSSRASASATADPRVAEVALAARRYVQALGDSMKTGSPAELDGLSVPGSQAEGNAGASAHIVRGTGRCFVVTAITFRAIEVRMAGSSDAMVQADYTLDGYDADWPSLKQLGSARSVQARHSLELQLVDSAWLVANEQ